MVGYIYIYIFLYECTPFYFYCFGVTPSHGAVVTSTNGGINHCDPFYMVLKGVTVGVATMAHCVISKGLELDSPTIKVHEVLEQIAVTSSCN